MLMILDTIQSHMGFDHYAMTTLGIRNESLK